MEVGIEDLPEEILVTIFEKLDLSDILRCSRVNKTWKNIVESEWFGSKYGGRDFVKFLINFNESSRFKVNSPNFSLTNCEIQQLKNLKFTSIKIIDNVVRAIFELAITKAVQEPEFCLAFARVCEVLSSKEKLNVRRFYLLAKEVENNDISISKNFQKIITIHSQKKFESDHNAIIANVKHSELKFENKVKHAQCTETIDMKKSLANIRFIGELYKCQILTDRKMHEIIRRLLLPIEPDENSVELLCCLLKSIGEKLELRTQQKISTGDRSLPPLYYHISRMKVLAKDKKLQPIARSMVKEVIDLRSNKWRNMK